MLSIRRSEERGRSRFDWLDSRHTFSFGDYVDPAHMGFRSLRVINEDWVAPGRGFDTHGHRDMEIVTWVLEGALEHKDSLGTGSIIRPGEIQRMSAGTGVQHSEFNVSRTEPVHLLQIWILPERRNLPPSYEQKTIPDAEIRGRFGVVAARSGGPGAVTIHQDAAILVARLEAGETAMHSLSPGRSAWLQVARGAVTVNGAELSAGDGAAVSEETSLRVAAEEPAEALLFDLA